MKRNFEYRRGQEQNHIAKKLFVIQHVWWSPFGDDYYLVKQKHRLSKAKVHCSCPLCSEKTNSRHVGRGSKDSRRLGNHWSIRDIRHGISKTLSEFIND